MIEPATFSVAAIGLQRYNVPEHGVCTVRDGVEMLVRDGFIIEGMLVLDGLLKVTHD